MAIPFPELANTIKFKVVRIGRLKFNEMYAEWATIPKGFAGKVPQAQQVVHLAYSYKRGGIARIYETPAVRGISPVDMVKKLADAHAFNDTNRVKGWTLFGDTIKGLFVVSTSLNPDAAKIGLAECKAAP